MRTPFLLWAALAACPGLCQFDLPIKEQYDHITHKLPYGPYAGVIAYTVDNPSNRPWSGYRYGEDIGNVLEGYLRMYETTGDKAYLVRFINLGLKAMAWRNHDHFFTDQSFGDNESPYMNGVLLWPMAHFVHLVLAENNDLAGQVIPDGLIAYQGSTVPVSVLPYSSTHTYASIATWFMYRCVESLDAILAAHWNTESAFCHGERICAVNMQAGFAGAMLYLGHLGNVNSTYSGLLSYLDKGALVAAMFSGDEPDDRCNCIEGNPVLIPFLNNSYWWHHKALSYKRRDCPYICWGDVGWADDEPKLEGLHEFVEDISHGVIDLVIPTLSNRFGLYTNGGYPFTEADLVRLRNAFTKHIAQWNGVGWQFKNAVDGSNGPVSSCEGCSPHPSENTFRYASLGWMPLQTFDGSSGAASGAGVYDIISEYYAAEIFPSPTHISGGLYHYGVAEVAAAQWERECFSLDLYNRELVYDQDFAAKNVLRVFPAGEAGASFADPVIYEPRFTVQPGVRSTFKAGSAVVFEPGFEATKESVVHAYIDPLGCDLEYKHRLPEPAPTYVELREEQRTASMPVPTVVPGHEPATNDAVRLYPNPAETELIVELDLRSNHEVRIELVNALSQSIPLFSSGMPTGDQQRIRLDVSGIAQGVYVCRVHVDEQVHVLPVVKKD